MSVSQDNVPQSDAPPIDDRPEIVTAPIAGSNELVLRTPMVAVGNLSTGSLLEVRVNGGPWRIAPVGEGDVAALPPLKQGVNNVLFRQIAADGKASATRDVRIRFDTIAPHAPLVSVVRGGLTNDPTLRFSGLEQGARLLYSIGGGAYESDYAPRDGVNTVRVRAVDSAGNESLPSRPVRFVLDRTAAAPLVSLQNDTGIIGDRITADGRLKVTGLEPGARVQFSPDGGVTWRRSFQAQEGVNQVFVRQIDRAGNISPEADFDFVRETRPLLGAAAEGFRTFNGRYVGYSSIFGRGLTTSFVTSASLVTNAQSKRFRIESTQVDMSIDCDPDGQNALVTTNLAGYETHRGVLVLEDDFEGYTGAIRGVFTRDFDGKTFSFVLAWHPPRP